MVLEVKTKNINLIDYLIDIEVVLGEGELNSRLTMDLSAEASPHLELEETISIQYGVPVQASYGFPISAISENWGDSQTGQVRVTGRGLRSRATFPLSNGKAGLAVVLKAVDPEVTLPSSLFTALAHLGVVGADLTTTQIIGQLAAAEKISVTDTGDRLVVRADVKEFTAEVISQTEERSTEGLDVQMTIPLNPLILPGDSVNGFTFFQVNHQFINFTTVLSKNTSGF